MRQGSPQQCTMERIHHSPPPHHQQPPLGLFARRCTPHHHRPYLHFPPPPNYPPPHPMSDDLFMLGVPGPSTSTPSTSSSQRHAPQEVVAASWEQQQQHQHHQHQGHHPNDYSYAYYEPGPPTKHTNIPAGGGAVYKEGSYHTRHTYLTRYGTEENIYEEITEIARSRMRPQQPSLTSLNQSLVEEELRRVQSGHRRVLGELNLSVEAMLMPSSSREGSDDTDRETEVEDQLADLLTVGPTDELLSPVPGGDLDSGFSGSSSGASYRSAAGSLRRGPERPKSCVGGVPKGGKEEASPSKGFWNRKGWKKLAGFSSNISLSKSHKESRLGTGSSRRSLPNNNNSTKEHEPRVRSGAWEETTTCDRKQQQQQQQQQTAPPPTLVHHTHPRSRTLQHTVSQRSSEDSWCSGSEAELSSDEESDRSAASSTRSNNGHLRSTLSKARTLCDKWRGSGGVGAGPRLSLDSSLPGDVSPQGGAREQGRLSRWFSIRRGSPHQYVIDNTSETPPPGGHKMPLLPEVEEEVFGGALQQRRQVPPSLPPAPPNLTQHQLKRRLIVTAIVHSENSYVATLQRLVNDYKKPLEESNPPILSQSKIATLFYRLPEILQCHTLFRIALAECVRNWDRDEKIGDVFVASFSKAIVLDIYSGFINNFSAAMDLAKMEAKRKSALADFLKVKQISSHDRLSFFGLMVKPVQRFPQFILLLQDLLKHTPQGHHDRMSLQLALTQLESLAEMLNERKREAEQFQAFKEMLRNISGKFSARPLADGNRYLLREDNVTQLEFNQCGMITKAKNRRLLLLNDLVVCVSVAPKASDDFGASERLSLKWTYPVSDVEIQDTSASPTLSRILTAGLNKGGSLKSNSSFDNSSQSGDNLCSEMSNLMHDYEVMSRIADLVGSLKGSYQELNTEQPRAILQHIQSLIQHKDEEMAWVDSCCLQLVAKTKGKEEVFTFQTNHPSVKKEWITELRLAQLALDPANSPAWEVPEQEQRPSTKMPLFVRAQCVYRSQHQTEVRCGCYYTITTPKSSRRRHRTQSYLWVCTSDGASSHITILTQHQQQTGSLKECALLSLVETQVTAMEYVKGAPLPCPSLAADTVWMGTDSRKLLLYAADEPEKREEVASAGVPDVITQIKYHCDSVFVALGSGAVLVYRRNPVDGGWLLKEPQVLNLGVEPVSSLLPINLCLYAACGKKVFVLSGVTGEVQKSFSIQHEHVGNVNLMAHSGIGLWISLKHSSTICLYHTETFKHLQDINIASNVMRVTSSGSRDCLNNNRSQVNVTALLACKGLLWVGTNVGIALTIPLPRLEGVPIISGRVNISYHAHFGPISFLLALQPKNTTSTTAKALSDSFSETTTTNNEERPKIEKQLSDSSMTNVTAKLRHHLTSSPVVIRRRRSKDGDMARLSKTLPRLNNGGSIFSTSSSSSADTCDVYGLYGELMYPKDYVGEENILTDPVYESLRRSDPELAAIPGKVSTLDRRLRMKVSRPRSLDLSNWSVDSRSSSLYTSSGSEESMAVRHSVTRSVSRNNSSVSRHLNDVCENGEEQQQPKKTAPAPSVVKGNCNVIDNNARRTVITLMGGRGYVNWRQPCCPFEAKGGKNGVREPNSNDAHIVIWELKL